MILKSMDEIDPPIRLDNPTNELSKQYLINETTCIDFDYSQVSFFF